ncbi:MAG: ankyrin repeat domain-containing protein [Oligoflexales bacterium]|nr:ankyrin repeat domain-containing protein [Oligoflexales bacterium]
MTGRIGYGATVLHAAVLSGNLPVVEYLTKNHKELVGAKTIEGWTALHLAVVRGHLPVVEYLAKKHPELMVVKDQYGYLAIEAAAYKKDEDVVQALKRAGSPVCNSWRSAYLDSPLRLESGMIGVLKSIVIFPAMWWRFFYKLKFYFFQYRIKKSRPRPK